ncbi:MAG: hypothetical protein N3G74_02400 [Candidatus Micrarchaeota archaeon]|nr:hypothetical protein [Candidatus Micrarchaeota archaeon]
MNKWEMKSNTYSNDSVTKDNSNSKRFAFSKLLVSASIFIASASLAISNSEICPKNSHPYFFSLQPGQKCRGERLKNSCFECRTKDGRAVNITIQNMQEKVEDGMKFNPDIGRKYSSDTVKKIKSNLKKWDKDRLEDLIKKLNGNLNEEERVIFRGALEHWPDIKYHSMRLGIDPRIAYLVAVAESRFVQKIGKSGERSPMQIMPKTMALMFNRYGKHDKYIRNMMKEGKDWRKDVTAQVILALYYLRDGISTVAPANTKLEQLSAEELLMIYHFYNRGHNNYVVDNWWQGDNFATCVNKYLKLYLEIENFINEFIKMNEESNSIISKTRNEYSNSHKKKTEKDAKTKAIPATNSSKKKEPHKENSGSNMENKVNVDNQSEEDEYKKELQNIKNLINKIEKEMNKLNKNVR